MPLEVRREMRIQHDGAPAHCTNVVREYLDETFGNRPLGYHDLGCVCVRVRACAICILEGASHGSRAV
jgi:hypothetical protein